MAFYSWLSQSCRRIFPSDKAERGGTLKIHCAMNERVSAQVAIRSSEENPMPVAVEVEVPASCSARIRRVGYVPVQHHNTGTTEEELDGVGKIPGYVPDPLFEETSLLLPPNEAHAFWLSIVPAPEFSEGEIEVKVTVKPENGKPMSHKIVLNVYPLRLPARKGFNVTNWFYADALIDWYKTDLFDERFWEILEKYFLNIVEKGQDTIYVPTFTPPLDGVKRPSQLLKVKKGANGHYDFNWDDVKKYIRLAKKCGFTNFEWSHLFTQWGVKNALRIYEGQGKDEKLLWPVETGATSAIYKNFLKQFLPQLRHFLASEKILNKSFFHLSDEPHGDEHLANYRAARELLTELAPWMKVMDALSQIDFAKHELVDMPVPSIGTALGFVKEKIPCWCYYCGGPRGKYLNRLMDTPLQKIAMHGFLFHRWPFLGFLHWGYNYWCESQTRNLIDPFTVQDGKRWPGWAYGDTFVVYPGPNGPIDSIRWEIFGEAMQDYALLQGAGISRDDKLMKKISSFEDFPKDASWRLDARRRILRAWAEKN